MKKGGQSNKRNQMLIDYYNQYAKPMSPSEAGRNMSGDNLDGILNEMEKN